jgi:hypothetical protein
LPKPSDTPTLISLDACVDALIAGKPWETLLPDDAAERIEVISLVAVAQRLLAFSKTASRPEPARKARMWRQVSARFSVIRSIALYRLPYLPPLWIQAVGAS